jgi:hypothetical protein
VRGIDFAGDTDRQLFRRGRGVRLQRTRVVHRGGGGCWRYGNGGGFTAGYDENKRERWAQRQRGDSAKVGGRILPTRLGPPFSGHDEPEVVLDFAGKGGHGTRRAGLKILLGKGADIVLDTPDQRPFVSESISQLETASENRRRFQIWPEQDSTADSQQRLTAVLPARAKCVFPVRRNETPSETPHVSPGVAILTLAQVPK